MTSKYELEAAYYQGLREMGGVDPEVAEDLGIPMSPESYESHVASSHEVQAALATTARRAIDGADEHAAIEAEEGRVLCANCNKPGCRGCGRS